MILEDWASGDAWQPIDVERSTEEQDEPLGMKEKFWVEGPAGQSWLFKFARERDGFVRGEDWAECLVHQLADLLGLPSAVVRLGSCGGRRGILSKNVVGHEQGLVHGNELLTLADANYDASAGRENPRYTVAAVHTALRDVGATPGWPELDGFNAFDQWASYVLLDAWVAGRDRHHENWAIVVSSHGRWLSPSFDHGNALGFAESPESHRALADNPDLLSRWARRGKSQHFAGKPSLESVAREALSLANAQASEHWLSRLRSIDSDELIALISAVPAAILSEAGHRFCIRLLELNRRRLLDGY